jgi:uncharacterized membrane protein YphA (DoxX/SURF4 family)
VDAWRWLAPAFLAVVMASAAGAKLARPAATRRTFAALGLPMPGLLARLVPPVEILTAIALIAAPRTGAVMATLLLLAFTAVLVILMAKGVEEPCACFGQIRTRPIGSRDLVRNAILLGAAALTLLAPPL